MSLTVRRRIALTAAVLVAVVTVAAAPRLVRAYWSVRSSNAVRRGLERAGELGCFSCHGELGAEGLPDPGRPGGRVPAWSGGEWIRYVDSDEQIRRYILDGGAGRTIPMPAFRDVLRGTDLEDLVAVFRVLSGMNVPPAGTAEREGLEVARRWRCFSCHGAAGSGGRPNPGSWTGFIPGWYGADFEDLVRQRAEFDSWILEGSIPRLRTARVAGYFLRRQRLSMPAYAVMSREDLDRLWAYVRWLAETRGGHHGGVAPP